MRRFGKDIEEAARRIRGLMTRQEAAKARSARVSAEADKLRAGGWRPYVGTVEQGPTLADAQAAIEAGFERDAAIEAEAAHRLGNRDTQLAQADARDQALPLPPPAPDRHARTVPMPPRLPARRAAGLADEELFNLFAFDNTSKWEGLKDHIYYDSKGVPTIGYGYALVVDGDNGWTTRDEGTLKNVGIVLSKGDRARLDVAAQALQSNRRAKDSVQKSASEKAAPVGDYELNLPESAARRTFDLTIPDYKGYVMTAIGRDNFNRLHPAQQAALFDLAYRGQAALLNNAQDLQDALTDDFASSGWDNTAQLLLDRARVDDVRTRTDIDYFRNPTAEFVYQVEPGETIDGIAAKVGWTRAEFLTRYPQYGNRAIKAGERIYFDRPTGSRRSGRAP